MSITREYRTFPLTVAGQTRDVPCFGHQGDTRYWTGDVFVGRIGRGTKTHRVGATVWKFASEAEARRRGYRGEQIVGRDEDGSVWAFQALGHALNRQVYITGWCDRPEDATSNHIFEGNTARKGEAR